MAIIRKLFVYGFPGLYGGAATELQHQFIIWKRMGVEIHLIPSLSDYRQQPLYQETLDLGVIIHEHNDWSVLSPGDPILALCNSEFLNRLHEVRQYTRRTIFMNCMTWLFDREKERMMRGEIAMFLYQNEDVRQKHMPELIAINPKAGAKFMTVAPYFEDALFPFHADRQSERFGCGRISRQDADKFSKHTLHIYEYFVSPKWKSGLFLGFDARSEAKIGKPYDWIRIARDHTVMTQQDFYQHCEIILQPTDTTENWPRVGFEAMASGSVLIVNNRGGWKRLVEHGKTGWLCDNERDFIYAASRMAYEPNLRADMAAAAREHGRRLGGAEASMASWQAVFDELATLPE